MRRALLFVPLALASCSIVADWGSRTDNRPCSKTGGCLAGYACVQNVCVATSQPGSDGGNPGWPDGGYPPAGDGGTSCHPETCAGLCVSGACVPAGCGDGHKNGDETDTDCGGKTCPACADGRALLLPQKKPSKIDRLMQTV